MHIKKLLIQVRSLHSSIRQQNQYKYADKSFSRYATHTHARMPALSLAHTHAHITYLCTLGCMRGSYNSRSIRITAGSVAANGTNDSGLPSLIHLLPKNLQIRHIDENKFEIFQL